MLAEEPCRRCESTAGGYLMVVRMLLSMSPRRGRRGRVSKLLKAARAQSAPTPLPPSASAIQGTRATTATPRCLSNAMAGTRQKNAAVAGYSIPSTLHVSARPYVAHSERCQQAREEHRHSSRMLHISHSFSSRHTGPALPCTCGLVGSDVPYIRRRS